MTRDEFLNRLPQLIQGYRADPEVFQRLSHITLLMIVGPSGVGKTTIIKRLNLPYVVSDTTRPKRPEEVEGEDYFFRTDYDKLAYDIEHGGFVQVAVDSGGDFKGARISSYPSFGLAVYAIMADVVPLFRKLGFERTITAFIVPPTMTEWMKRMQAHNLNSTQLERRMGESKRSLNFALYDDHTHFILNDVLEDAVAQTSSLVGGKIDHVREAFAKQTAEKLHRELNSSL